MSVPEGEAGVAVAEPQRRRDMAAAAAAAVDLLFTQ